LRLQGKNHRGGKWNESKHQQMLEIGSDISNSITSVAKDYYIIEIYEE